MLVREIIGIHYAYRVKYKQGRKGHDWRIDEQASVHVIFSSTLPSEQCMLYE